VPRPYTSYLYRVDYLYDADRDGVDVTVSTYMRIYLPRRDALMPPSGETAYGVVLLVDGGGTGGLGDSPSDDSQFSLAGALAEGAEPGPVRPGPPMVVITFTQPGRYFNDYGTAVNAADGDSFFETNWTPGTVDVTGLAGSGNDICGSMTMAAMEAVVAIAMALLDDFDIHYGFTCDRRFMVSSNSNGLSAASKWIVSTSWDVHALVDWEGPPDSLAQSLATYAFTPIGWDSAHWDASWDVPADEQDNQHPPELEYFGLDTLTFDCWQAWFGTPFKGGVAYSFFFRPPLDVLPDLSSASEISIDGTGEDTRICGMYVNWYQAGVYNGSVLSFYLYLFWWQRSAAIFLPLLADASCAYIRIQFDEDHAQPPWWFNRHANIALNAAWDDSANQHVYYADTNYSAGMGTLSPTQLTGVLQETIDEDTFDPADHASWPDWPNDRGQKTLYQLDLLRCAYETEFGWTDTADTDFGDPWEAYT